MNRSNLTALGFGLLSLAWGACSCTRPVQVSLSPEAATIPAGGTVAFAATVTGTSNSRVSFSVQEGALGGTVDSTGLYTAPASAGTFHVVATSAADRSKTGSATITVMQATDSVQVQLSPIQVTLSAGASQQFSAAVTGSANTAVTWSVEEGASGGAISSTGLYTAPANAGTFHVVAKSQADPSRSARATVTVTASQVSISVSPEAVTLSQGSTQQFTVSVTGTANTAVSWSVQEGAAGGSVDAAGLYTAPSTAGIFHVVATSQADTAKSAVAQVTVSAAPSSVSVSPAYAVVQPGGTQQFAATVTGISNPAVTWSIQQGASGGSISPSGLYTAPATGGSFVILATSQADPTHVGYASVDVLPSAGYTLTGTVSYAGTRTGRVYVLVSSGSGGSGFAGTSLAAPGAFNIRGVRANGMVTVRAFMDTLGTADFNLAADPEGSSSVSLPSTAPISIALTDPVASTPAAPAGLQVVAGDRVALLFWDPVTDAQGREVADRYKVYWSSGAPPGPGNPSAKSKTVRAGSWFAVVADSTSTPLSNGTYRFAVTAVNNGNESGTSNLVQSAIGPGTGGYGVSGAVSFSGFTPSGPLYLLAWGQTAHLARVPSPASPQAFTLPSVPNGYYYLYAWIDTADDGELFGGDVHSFYEPSLLQVSGAAVGGQNLTLPSGASLPSVTTEHGKYGGSEHYQLDFTVTPNAKQPVKVAVLSGPSVSGPMDLGIGAYGSHYGFAQLGGTSPSVGQSYSFELTYADGTTASETRQVTAVIAGFATPQSPVGSGTAAPTFLWSAPSPAPASFTYDLYLYQVPGGLIWYQYGLPSAQTSVAYNADGRALLPQLGTGSYLWYLAVRDGDGNRSMTSASFSAP
ncbi:MAG: hypothetical protein HYZ28_03285 [Myxococcales bacterium]|nr:hypothetical protein [Myxococcales bacterium]